MKKFNLEIKLMNLLGKKVEDQYFEDMKYRLTNRSCVTNKINVQRELRLMDTIIRYARGPSVLVVVGINHLERLKICLETFHDSSDEYLSMETKDCHVKIENLLSEHLRCA
jgi:hypothetical protein